MHGCTARTFLPGVREVRASLLGLFRRKRKASTLNRQELREFITVLNMGSKLEAGQTKLVLLRFKRACEIYGFDPAEVFDSLLQRITGLAGICDKLTLGQLQAHTLALCEFSRYKKGTREDRERRAVFHAVGD